MEVREPSARYLMKPAFKQTEVGVIPEDWEVRLLENVAQIRTGIAKNTNAALSDPVEVPYLRVANVQDGYLDLQEVSMIRVERHDLKRFAVLPNDVLMNEGGDLDKLGRGALWQGQIRPCVHQNHVFVVRCKDTLLPEFLNAWTSSPAARRYFLLAGRQTTNLASINKTSLGQLPVPIPTCPAEQQAIAEALGDADALIEALEQLLAKKRQIKQGAMQELLTGQKRLPGFEQKSGYKQTDLGPVPEDWDVIPIGQIAQCLIGLTYSPNDVRSFGTLVLRSSNVQNGCLAFDDNVYVEMELPLRVITQEGDILICVRNGSRQLIGKCALIDEAAAGSAFGAFMAVLRSKSSRFLFQQFQSHILKQQIRDVMGATINQITNKDMAVFKVIWPAVEAEQTAIATILSDLDAELAALETKLAKARQLKQGMMQELLTGRIRLV